MNTFKCWIIANFEIFSFMLTVIIGAILFFWFSGVETVGVKTNSEISDPLAYILTGIFAYWIFFIIPTNKAGVSFFKYFVTLGGLIFLTWGVKSQGWILIDLKGSQIVTYLWIVFSIASVISGWFAYYTFVNISEVVSRRMLWRNSNVSLYEFTWLYTLDRFCGITVSIVVCILPITLLIFILRL